MAGKSIRHWFIKIEALLEEPTILLKLRGAAVLHVNEDEIGEVARSEAPAHFKALFNQSLAAEEIVTFDAKGPSSGRPPSVLPPTPHQIEEDRNARLLAVAELHQKFHPSDTVAVVSSNLRLLKIASNLKLQFLRPVEAKEIVARVDLGATSVSSSAIIVRAPAENRSFTGIIENLAFIAMPMRKSDRRLPAVLQAIKRAASSVGIEARRIDEDESNERITDRMIAGLRKAEFVIADLTDARPNVYWEAGFAHALGKTPIYIAREGTERHFDLKDYPIIDFKNPAILEKQLSIRLASLVASRKQ